MTYLMLLWPHSNVRYQNETLKLAESELRLMLDFFKVEAQILPGKDAQLPALRIVLPEKMDPKLMEAIRGHSLLYALFEVREDGALLLLAAREEAYVGSDLPGILKYKGKTNEIFLQLLVNAALYAGGYAHKAHEQLELLDPMCGRATTLFVAANRGWNATGSDIDRNDLSEAEKFLKRYFEYHRFKHAIRKTSRTVAGEKPAQMTEFSFADTPEHFKADDTRMLRLVNADAQKTREVFGKEKFHMVVCDLPYGVQHGAVGAAPEKLLRNALTGWYHALKKGGTVAVSFNAQTLKTEKVRALMQEAGFEVKFGGAYDGFSHWVEQAVTRDIAVCRKVQ